MSFSRPIQWYHSRADPIWPDGTFTFTFTCTRVVPLESPLKGHQPLYVFDFFISVLNIWNNFKVLSRFMQNWTQPLACSNHGLHRILSSYWLAHFHLMKNPPKCSSILLCIAERWNSLLTSRNPKNNWYVSRIFGARFESESNEYTLESRPPPQTVGQRL